MNVKFNLHGSLLCVCFAALWEVSGIFHLVSVRLLPRFSTIICSFWGLIFSGVLPLAVLETFSRMLPGLFLAAGLMVPLGIACGRSEKIWSVIELTLEALRGLPPTLIIFPAILVMGLGDGMKIFSVFFAASFPILLNTVDGVRSIPELFLDTAKTFKVSNRDIYLNVVFPASLPGIFSGLKTALPIAFIVAIISEMIGGTNGIGLFLIKSQRSFDIPEMYAAIWAIGLSGAMAAALLKALETTSLAWYFGYKNKNGSI